jgi:glutamine amidotransferase
MGNLRSVQKGLQRMGFEAEITSERDEIERANALVLPGVGAFGDGMEELRSLGLEEMILRKANLGTPFLGICLGLQVLFEKSEESPGVRGLGIIPGRVRRFSPELGLCVPHMGWNTLHLTQEDNPLFAGLPEEAYVYFVHSFYADPDGDSVTAATCEYGIEFAAAVRRGTVFGVQFHPEKSQAIGLKILGNFGRSVEGRRGT